MSELEEDNMQEETLEGLLASWNLENMLQLLKDEKVSLDVLKIWPQYKNPNGLKLIDKDFAFLYGSYDSILSWGCEKMIKLFNGLTKLKNGKSSVINELLDNISIDDAKRDPDMFALKVLWVLHYWLGPTARYARKSVFGKKEMARFSSKDSQESFLFMGNTMQLLQDHIEFIQKRGDNIQPFILAIGSFEKN